MPWHTGCLCWTADEPGAHTKGDAQRTTSAQLASWLGEMAQAIKAIDRDGTLVATGTAGYSRYYRAGFGDHLPDLIRAAGPGGIRGVDLYCLHYYGGRPLARWIDDARAVLPAGGSVRSWLVDRKRRERRNRRERRERRDWVFLGVSRRSRR